MASSAREHTRNVLALRAYQTAVGRTGLGAPDEDALRTSAIHEVQGARRPTTATPTMLVLLDYYQERGIALARRAPQAIVEREVLLTSAAAFGLAGIDPSDDEDWFSDFVNENAQVFLRENGGEAADDGAQERVTDLIYAKAEASLTNTRLQVVANAIEAIINHVHRGAVVGTRVERNGIRVTLHGALFARVAEEAQEGVDSSTNYAVLQGQINATLLRDVVGIIPTVYGISNVRMLVERAMNGFEPYIGSRRELLAALRAAPRSRRGRYA